MDIFFLISFLIPLSVYTLTLEPTVFWLDSGIYLSAVKCFGIAYPPGFPLYILLAKLWSYLPLKDFSWRINFLSAIFGALACSFVYLSTKRILKSLSSGIAELLIRVISLTAAVGFGFSWSHWSQAINAEVYSLNSLLVAIILYLFIRFDKVEESGRKRLILLLGLFYGLSFANHPMTIGLLPAFVYFFWVNKETIFKFKQRFIAQALIVFLLSGLLPYIYMPIRALQNPAMNWGNPVTLSNFFNHITGRQWTGEAVNFALFNAEFFQNIAKAAQLSLAQFKLFGIALSILGFFYYLGKDRKSAGLLFLIYIASIFLGVVYKTGEFESWFIPAYLVMSVWIGIGLFALSVYLGEKLNRALAAGLVTVACGLLVIPVFIGNYHKLDRSKNYYAQDYGRNLLKNLPQGSILLLLGDNPLSTAAFSQIVLGEREDVYVFHYKGALHTDWYRETLRHNFKKGMVLPQWRCPFQRTAQELQCNVEFMLEFIKNNIDRFPIFEILPEPIPGYYLIPAGMVYKISQDPDEELSTGYWDFSFHDEEFKQAKDIQAKYNSSWLEMLNGYISAYKNLADVYLWKKRQYPNAVLYYNKALGLIDNYNRFAQFDPVFSSNILASLGIAYLEENNFEMALENFDLALGNFIFNALAYAYKGMLYERLGKIPEAREYYQQALRIEPGNELVKLRLAQLQDRNKSSITDANR